MIFRLRGEHWVDDSEGMTCEWRAINRDKCVFESWRKILRNYLRNWEKIVMVGLERNWCKSNITITTLLSQDNNGNALLKEMCTINPSKAIELSVPNTFDNRIQDKSKNRTG